MEEKDKLTIRKNYVELVNKTDLNQLLPRLIATGVFSQRIAEPYQNTNKTELDRKRALFVDIQRRGPLAFDKLISVLKDTHNYSHTHLAYLLEGIEIPHNETPMTNRNMNHHNLNNRENIIEEEVDEPARMYASSGVKPFTLNEAQRPNHIRQLSQESPFVTIDLTDEPLKVIVKKAERFFDSQPASKVPLYRMRGKIRGAYLGINNMEFINNIQSFRNGAQVDEENLKDLFKQMGFNISTYRNQTYLDMKRTIKDFSSASTNPVIKRADCLVIAIMSHGEEGDTKESSQVVASDGKHLPVSWILDQFNNFNCPEFQNKPKIFIFQICRGSNLHCGISVQKRTQQDGMNSTPGYRLRGMTDMLIAYSTLPGDKSYRDIHRGTWYIQLICQVFMNHAYDTDIEHLLKMVDQHLSYLMSDDENMQTSTYESRAFKRCYLHPALYE
ncbi:Death regulator Nedd2-like caspase [Carabus blaptoides fortunei]